MEKTKDLKDDLEETFDDFLTKEWTFDDDDLEETFDDFLTKFLTKEWLKKERQAEVYKNALSEGAAEVSYCRVMLLGPAGVGKTCLSRGLMGFSFDPSTNSTKVADVHSVRPMIREWITPDHYGDKWCEVTEQDEILELAQLMVLADADKKLLSDTYHSPVTASDPLSKFSTVDSSFSLDKLQNLMESNIVQQAIAEAQELSTFGNVKCHPFFHLWDCGGQPVFLELLPLFLTSRTLFLILFNASINLEEPWESFYHMDGKKYHEEKVNMSTLQMMERWISMIYSHLLKKDEHGVDPGYPRVIPIGARKDKLIESGGNPRQVMKVIRDSIHGKAFNQVVEEPMIIDNTTSGSSAGEDEGYKVVREKVLDMAMSKLRKVNTPIAWILFRKLLQLLSKTSPNANVISLQEVIAIASIAKVKSYDVKEVLRFYHELGVFLYYPSIEGLKEKVILDPKWFVECLGKVLSLHPHNTDEKYEDGYEWKLFRSKGIIVKRLLNKTCQGIEPKEFIELLTHFLLAVEVETDQYFDKSMKQFFIPAILPYSSVQPASSSPVAPLHVTFDSGFVVPGFFTRLSVTMLKESNDPEIPFKLDLYFGDDDDKSEIYHNRVTYEMSTKQSLRPVAPLFVTVSEEISCIAIDVNSYSNDVSPQRITEIQNNFISLKSHVKACSEQVSQSLHSNITESISSPQVKVVCQAKAECQRKGIHYLNPPSHEGLSIDDCKVTCERNRKILREITIEEACWFKVQINSANIPSSKDLGTSTSRSLENAMPPHNSQDTVKVPSPMPKTVFDLMKRNSAKWDDFGRELGISLNERQILGKEQISAEAKLERVIHKWIESQCLPVTWDNLIEVLEKMKLRNVIEDGRSTGIIPDPTSSQQAKEQEEVITKLSKSDLEKEKEIRQLKDHLQEVERKLLQDTTMELPQEVTRTEKSTPLSMKPIQTKQKNANDTNNGATAMTTELKVDGPVTTHTPVTDIAVNYNEVFKNNYDDLVSAMATSCSLSNVARGLKSVHLISQSAVDFVNTNRLSEPDQCVIRLLREIMEFLRISKNASKKCQKMVDFCKVLRDQDSPLLSEMASQLSDNLGI